MTEFATYGYGLSRDATTRAARLHAQSTIIRCLTCDPYRSDDCGSVAAEPAP